MVPNFYDALGIRRTASTVEVRAAYLRLARIHHPDLNRGNPSAAEKFRQIQLAYDVLGDPDQREKFDRDPRTFGSPSVPPATPSPPPDPPFATTNHHFESTVSAQANYEGLSRSHSRFPWVAMALVAASVLIFGSFGAQYFWTQLSNPRLVLSQKRHRFQPTQKPRTATKQPPASPIDSRAPGPSKSTTAKYKIASAMTPTPRATASGLNQLLHFSDNTLPNGVDAEATGPTSQPENDWEPTFDLAVIPPGRFIVSDTTMTYRPATTLAGIDLSPATMETETELTVRFLDAMIDAFSPTTQAPRVVRKSMADSDAAQKHWHSKLSDAYREVPGSAAIDVGPPPGIMESMDYRSNEKYGGDASDAGYLDRLDSVNDRWDLELSMVPSLNQVPPVHLHSVEQAGHELPAPYSVDARPVRARFDLRTSFSVPESSPSESVPPWIAMKSQYLTAHRAFDLSGTGWDARKGAAPFAFPGPLSSKPRTANLALIQSTYTGYSPTTNRKPFGLHSTGRPTALAPPVSSQRNPTVRDRKVGYPRTDLVDF